VLSTTGIAEPSGGAVQKMLVPAKPRYVVIASHDCEFNDGKRDRIVVARLMAVPQHQAHQVDTLRLSNDIEARHMADEPVDGVDNFLFDPLDDCLPEPHVAVFTTLTALSV
jgi:hypothetical protein